MLLDGIGVDSVFIFQPFLLTGVEGRSRELSWKESKFLAAVDPKTKYLTSAAYEKWQERKPEFVHDLSKTFLTESPSQIYVDLVHLSSEADQVIASEIIEILNKEFASAKN